MENKKIVLALGMLVLILGGALAIYLISDSSTDVNYSAEDIASEGYSSNSKFEQMDRYEGTDDDDDNTDFDDGLDSDSDSVDLSGVDEDDLEDYVDYEYDTNVVNSDWDSDDATYVTMSDGETYEIDSAGTYVFSGDVSDGQIVVDSDDDNAVILVFDDFSFSSSEDSPIVVLGASEVVIILEDGTDNYITDSSSYVDPDTDDSATPAAIYSTDDLYITGDGSLTVTSEGKTGIQGKDQIVIISGEITVDAAKEAIKAKDYLVIEGGDLDLTAGEDGISATEDDDLDKGYIVISGGDIVIEAEQDGVSAKTYIVFSDADLEVVTNGADSTTSAKGLKAGYIEINSGSIVVDSYDDSIHASEAIVVNGGSLTLSSGDDGMHSDETLEINGGSISILESYEGLEGKMIYINDGDVSIVSSDDGINAASGTSSGGMMGGGMAAESGVAIYINGGYVYMNANGDGLDSNGDIYITDGEIYVDGPTNNGNGALDCNGEFIIDEGYLVAVGASGMAESPDSGSDQASVLLSFSTMSAGTEIVIENSDGDEILNFESAKTFSSIVFSSEDLEVGETYTIYFDGESAGDFTVSSVSTSLSNGGSSSTGMPTGMDRTMPTGGMTRPGMR